MKNIRYSFENKKVLITGGASGIGLEIAKQFVMAGAVVIIWDRSKQLIQEAEQEFKKKSEPNLHVSFFEVDVTDLKSCEMASLKIGSSIDILVNNAGITKDKSFKKMTSEEWQQVIDVNLTGVFNATKSVFVLFDPKSRQNRIINISSIVAFFGNFGQSNYAASKAGVIALTKTWAREFAASGITVNAIAPGFIETAMTEKMPIEIKQQMTLKVPLQRLGTPQDIAQVCLFLASEESSYLTATIISVDGGLVI
jgi:3-oxoacyl-[acyl-carrier protein] reductase